MDVLKAIRMNDLRKLEKRIKKGFNVNTEIAEKIGGKQVYTIPICLATARRHMTIVEMLLNYGADIHKWNSDWSSPLHTATFHGFTELVTLFLKYGVDVNRRDIHGDTALNIAIRTEHTHAVNLLIKANSDIDIKNNEGENAQSLINCINNITIFRMIKEKAKAATDVENPYETPVVQQKMKLPPFAEHDVVDGDNDEIDEKQKLRKKLMELEIREKNDARETNLKEIYDLEREIAEGMEENKTLKKNIIKLQEKLDQNEIITNLKKERKKKLENELKEIESSKGLGYKPVKNDMEEGLECPICFCIPLPPKKVYQCKNGHIHCEDCQKQLAVCPMCRIALNKTEPIRNRAFEEIVSSVFEK